MHQPISFVPERFVMKYASYAVLIPIVSFAFAVQGRESTAASSSATCTPGSVSQADPKIIDHVGQFLTQLQAAIAAQDTKRVAEMIHYPLRVVSSSGTRFVRSEDSFVRNYDRVFPLGLRKLVLSERPECVNIMAQGFTIGAGTVWFTSYDGGEFKVFTLTPPIPSPNAHPKQY
jgi:hypothetical protein